MLLREGYHEVPTGFLPNKRVEVSESWTKGLRQLLVGEVGTGDLVWIGHMVRVFQVESYPEDNNLRVWYVYTEDGSTCRAGSVEFRKCMDMVEVAMRRCMWVDSGCNWIGQEGLVAWSVVVHEVLL